MSVRNALAAGCVAVIALAGSGCGGSGDGDEVGTADEVTVGGGVVVEDGGTTAVPTTVDTVPGTGAESPPATSGSEVSPHPTDASGRPIANTTIREAEGLVLQLTVDETVGYEGDLVIDLLVTNQREASIRYDAAPAEGAYLLDEGGRVVWSNGRCVGTRSAADHPTLAPGDSVRLTFQLPRDGGDDGSCPLADGRYRVVGQLFWCDAGTASAGECPQLTATASHPVPITLDGG